jgi:hypothetical protein
MHHQDAVATCRRKQRNETRAGGGIHGEVYPELTEHSVRFDEVPLHVDEEQRRMRRADEFGEVSEDVFAVYVYHFNPS